MSAADRASSAIRAIIAAILPQLFTYARWEYIVQAVHPGIPPVPTTIDCVSTNAKTAALVGPILPGIILWPGSSGVLAIPKVGTKVRIGFANGDGAKPEVVGLDPTAIPILTTIAGGVKPVARVGDTVTITSAQISAAIMVAGSNPVTVTHPLVCTITSGSQKAQCG